MKGYETIFIMHPDLTEEEVQKALDGYSEVLTERGGQITKSESWGLRTLAFTVKKQKKGTFVYLLYSAPHEAVEEMERLMGISDQCIRFMTVRIDDLEKAAEIKPQLLDDPTLNTQEA